MYHFLAEFYSSDSFEIKASSALVGNIKRLGQFCITGSVNSKLNVVGSYLKPVALKDKANIVPFVTTGNKFNIDLKELSDDIQRLNYNVFFQFEDGSEINVGALAIVSLAWLPKVTLIVGSPRSGTTAVGNAVQKAFAEQGHGESHIAELFQKLLDSCEQYVTSSPAARSKGTLTHQVSQVHMQSLQFESLRSLHRDFYGEEIVIDKTPGGPMIQALPLLMKVYPQAKVIYCKRRGLENIASRLKKFPKVSFLAHCKQWRNTHHMWCKAKEQITYEHNRKSWFCVIEQYLLATNVDSESRKIAEHLAFTPEQHQALVGYLRHESPQKSASNDALSLETIKWTEEQKLIFMDICSKEMNRQKYSLDETYFK